MRNWITNNYLRPVGPNTSPSGADSITVTGDDQLVSHPFATKDPRFVVVTLKGTPGITGTVELYDSSDNFQTEEEVTSVALDSSGVTVMRVGLDVTANAPMRNALRVKVSTAGNLTLTAVLVTYAG